MYHKAVIWETQRLCNVLPFGGTHRNRVDVKLGDYSIPKGTVFKTLMTELHMGEQWSQPEVFKPDRFIDQNGKLVKSEYFLPFAYGKRKCLGDSLAKSQLFLFLARLVQEFIFLPPSQGTGPSLDYDMGLTLSPKPFKVTIVQRK